MIDVMTIKVGERLQLREGIVAEVLENMEDGMWLQVRYLAFPATRTTSAPRSSVTRRISSRS